MMGSNPTYEGPQSLVNKSQQIQNHKGKRFNNKVISWSNQVLAWKEQGIVQDNSLKPKRQSLFVKKPQKQKGEPIVLKIKIKKDREIMKEGR